VLQTNFGSAGSIWPIPQYPLPCVTFAVLERWWSTRTEFKWLCWLLLLPFAVCFFYMRYENAADFPIWVFSNSSSCVPRSKFQILSKSANIRPRYGVLSAFRKEDNGHLENVADTPLCVSASSTCVSRVRIQIGRNRSAIRLDMSYIENFMLTAAAILRNWHILPLLCFSNSTSVFQSLCQSSSESGSVWPFHSGYLIYKTAAAAAILEIGPILSLLRSLN
jgi:hypothetical protein